MLYTKIKFHARKKSLSLPHSCHFCNQGSCNMQVSTYNFVSRAARLTERFGQSGSFVSTGSRHRGCAKEPVVSFSKCRSHFL